MVADSRSDMAKRIIFETPPSQQLRLSAEDQVRHETIHRAWLLYNRKKRLAHEQDLQKQFAKMEYACDMLQKLDPRLYAASKIEVTNHTFPLDYRTPTDTPSPQGWNCDWVPPEDSKG